MALVSVIVTAYNIEQYLAGCLDSILAQTYPKLEIILVDDGSTDGTGRIAEEYRERYDKIQVLHKKNGGPSSARNAGLALAHGAYIGYVDGDDRIQPEMYEKMLKACMDTGAEIAICSYRQIGEGTKEIQPSGKIYELTREQALDIYINDNQSYHIYHSVWSKLFKREVLDGITFREGKKSEDIMYTTMALVAAKKCVFVDEALYDYTMDRKDSIMNSRLHERRFEDELPFWREQIDYLKEHGFFELSQKAAYQFYRTLLFYYIDFKRRRMPESAKKLADYLKLEEGRIRELYQKAFVGNGDRVRMKLFLKHPAIYYRVTELYDTVIVPIKRRL